MGSRPRGGATPVPPPHEAGWGAREVAEVQEAARNRAMISEARVVLAERLECPVGEALQHLIWLARDLSIDLDEAAALVVRGEAVPNAAASDFARVPPPAPPAATERSQGALFDPQRYRRPESDEAVEQVLRRTAAEDSDADAKLAADVPDDPAARAVLDSCSDSVAHMVPLRDEAQRVTDFLITATGERTRDLLGRGASELTGRRLLRVNPGVALSGLFDAYVRVLETGIPYARERFEFATVKDGLSRTGRFTVRCVPVPTGVCVTWRSHDEENRVRRRLDRAERLAQIGFGEWSLTTGDSNWSEQMLANYGRTRQDGPVTLDRISEIVTPEDMPLVEQKIISLMNRRRPVEMEHGIVTPAGEIRRLWTSIEPVLDASGRLVSINIMSQDLTRRWRTERALAATRRQFVRQQAEAAHDRRVAVALRGAIHPTDREVPDIPGLRIAARSLPAESTARIGGDWYATRALPDGRALLAIGDAAGHGLPAAAAMARTRNGLLGLAYTEQIPGRLVGWLNELVSDLDPATVGTALIAYFDPRTRTMSWSTAGHPPPLLLRDGRASQLDVSQDPVLGTFPDIEYATNATPLRPGDLVLLYTDGLVERRGADLDDQIALLAKVVEGCDPEPDGLVDSIIERMEYDPSADDTTLFAVRVDS